MYIVLSEEEDNNMKFVGKLKFSDKNNIVVTNYIFGIKKIKENEETCLFSCKISIGSTFN